MKSKSKMLFFVLCICIPIVIQAQYHPEVNSYRSCHELPAKNIITHTDSGFIKVVLPEMRVTMDSTSNLFLAVMMEGYHYGEYQSLLRYSKNETESIFFKRVSSI